jgi:tetratricopeptide (TPR) repeat protein
MHGPLHEIGLVEVLQLLGRGARDGTLEVVGPDPTAPRTVHLRGGRVVSVEPDAGQAAVEDALVARHLLSRDALRLDVGDDVRDALRQTLAMRAIGTMLHWTRGRFDFAEGKVPAGPLDIAVESILVALVDGESRRVELGAQLADFQLIPTFAAPERLGEGDALSLDPLDWRILDAVDGRRGISGVAAMVDEPLELVGERVRRLEGAAILELSAAPVQDALAARTAIEAGQYDTAVSLLESRVERMQDDREAWRLLGLAEVGAGRFDRAIRAWEAWQRADPSLAPEATALIAAARTMLEALRDPRD